MLAFVSLGFQSILSTPALSATVPLVELIGHLHGLGKNDDGSVTIIPTQTVQRTLAAGSYRVTPVMVGLQKFAWNPFGTEQNCDTEGGNCSAGWVADYALGTGGADVIFSTPATGNWLTPLQAFGHAVPIEFILGSETTIHFWLTDGGINDNLGGMKLNVQQVPLPGALLLLMSALAGFGLMSVRTRLREILAGGLKAL